MESGENGKQPVPYDLADVWMFTRWDGTIDTERRWGNMGGEGARLRSSAKNYVSGSKDEAMRVCFFFQTNIGYDSVAVASWIGSA